MRADKFFAEKFGSRTKAKEALMRGEVLFHGVPLKASDEAEEGREYTFLDGGAFVSNGGKKLEKGLSVFGADVCGKIFADLGASYGGFTDCLLRRGARRVYCVDVGESQLARSISEDPRVVVMDRTNARSLKAEDFGEPLGGVVADLSFISLRLVLPAIAGVIPVGGQAFVLFKPQFECEGKGIKPNGIVPRSNHPALLTRFYTDCLASDLAPRGIVSAPISAGKNVEYVVWLEKNGTPISLHTYLDMAKKTC